MFKRLTIDKMLESYQTFLFMYRRASYPVYLKFRINKFELQLLCMLSAYLRYQGRKIVSKNEFFDVVTANSREIKKMHGYLAGCIEKKFIGSYEYISYPGSMSIGISELGLSVIKSFENDLMVLAERYKVKENVSLSIGASELKKYTKLAA